MITTGQSTTIDNISLPVGASPEHLKEIGVSLYVSGQANADVQVDGDSIRVVPGEGCKFIYDENPPFSRGKQPPGALWLVAVNHISRGKQPPGALWLVAVNHKTLVMIRELPRGNPSPQAVEAAPDPGRSDAQHHAAGPNPVHRCCVAPHRRTDRRCAGPVRLQGEPDEGHLTAEIAGSNPAGGTHHGGRITHDLHVLAMFGALVGSIPLGCSAGLRRSSSDSSP